MRNADVVDNFIRGIDDCMGSNLYSGKGELINYTTLIALRRHTGLLVLNGDNYSRSTSVHQNRIRRSGVKYVETTEKDIYEIRYSGHTNEKQVFSRNEQPLEDEDI